MILSHLFLKLTFFSAELYKNIFKTFSKGERYDYIYQNGEKVVNSENGYGHISNKTCGNAYISCNKIMRKVIVYKNTVIDYTRKFQHMYYDVTVPTIFEKQDVVLIKRDGHH